MHRESFVARNIRLVLFGLVLAGLCSSGVRSDEPTAGTDGDPYPLRKCVILDCPLETEIETIFIGEREIRVCCEQCVGDFSDNEDTWLEVVDEKIVEQQSPVYPLDSCIVDGKPLNEFSTIDLVLNNRLFRLCCEECSGKLEQQPSKYFAVLNRAVIKEQKASYPLADCIVSGAPLGQESIDHVVGNQLIRLAGPDQIDAFDENPGKYLEQLRDKASEKR